MWLQGYPRKKWKRRDWAIPKELFDLVITDLRLPQEHWLATIAELRSENPEPKLIALSAEDLNGHPAARKLGAKHTFIKPFDTEELLDAIETELGNSVDCFPTTEMSDLC